MKKVEIVINGKAYPCRETMGAMLRFHRETGRDATKMDPSSVSDLCTYLWCCVSSACKADGTDFGMSLMDFADAVTAGDMTAWAAGLAGNGAPAPEAGGEGQKKS